MDILPFDVEGATITYNLLKRKRQKHINIRVHHDGTVTVSAPVGTSMDRIRSAIAQKEQWIRRHVLKAREKMAGIDELGSIPFGGDRHKIEIEYDPSKRGWIHAIPDERIIVVRTASRSAAVRKKELARFFKRQARTLAQREVAEVAGEMGITYERIYLRDQKTRWGSSSARGNLSLNWRIVFLPQEARRYLYVHELAHQVHMNHSAKFWGKVARHCPDYHDLDHWLKENSFVLGLYR